MTQPLNRCIECEEIELARVSDARPSQTLPLPAAALDGFPEGRSAADLTRRRLLQYGVAGFASVYGPRVLGLEEVFDAAVADAASPTGATCLLVLYLAGGNDGLNTIVPGTGLGADYAAYQATRPTIYRQVGASGGGRVGSQDIPATGNQLAWSNVCVSTPGTGGIAGDNGSPTYGFDTLYGNGLGGAGSDLAILPAADYTPANYSHFSSSDYWFAGALSSLTTGWLGRWVDNNGSPTNPLQAVSLDSALSKAIRTADKPVCAIESFSRLGFTMNPSGGYGMPPGAPSQVSINARMAAMSGVPAGADNLYLARSRSAYGLGVQVATQGSGLAGIANTSVIYPAGYLGNRLKQAAKLFAAGLGTRIVTVHWGGFDTHGNQITDHDPQLIELSRAMGAFKADLQARGVEQNVVTLAFSEFGRRVDENASLGTDHGAGGLMMLSGTAVKGGLASEFPGCQPADLYDGNLQVTTDFRSVYQAVLSEWLGGDLTGVLPGGPFPPIQRYDGGNTLIK